MPFYSYIFLVFYSLVLLLFVYKISFFESSLLNKKQITGILSLKIFIGVFYIFVHKTLLSGGDIFMYFKDAETVHQTLFQNPVSYFKLVFMPNNVAIAPELSEAINAMGFWGDTGAYMMVRFNAIIRLISFGNIYIHGVFSAFFSFIGCYLIARVFAKNVRSNKWVSYSVFLFPSLLFWTSGLHKEFVSVLALGLILYHFFELTHQINRPKHIFWFIIGLILFFFTRNYMLLALIPSLMAFTLYKVFKIRFRRAVFFCLVLFISFLTYQKIPGYNKTGFEVVLEKRNQFEDLNQGTTSIKLEKIEPNFVSLMQNSPKALYNTLLRPLLFDFNFSEFLFIASLENILILSLLIFALINFHKLKTNESNFVVFMALYSISLLLIIGWIVPNVGAILRYRSTALVVLIPTLVFVASKSNLFKKYFSKY